MNVEADSAENLDDQAYLREMYGPNVVRLDIGAISSYLRNRSRDTQKLTSRPKKVVGGELVYESTLNTEGQIAEAKLLATIWPADYFEILGEQE